VNDRNLVKLTDDTADLLARTDPMVTYEEDARHILSLLEGYAVIDGQVVKVERGKWVNRVVSRCTFREWEADDDGDLLRIVDGES
jgi:hypothetical protein